MTSLHHEEAPPAGRQRSRARLGIWIFFLLHGTLVGTWAARIPDIKANLGLDDGDLGLALLACPVGTLLGLVPARIAVDRLGSGRSAVLGAPAHSLAILGLALAWNFETLALSLFVFGLLPVAFVIAINTAAVQVERWYQRSLMSSFHAAYSIGAAAGALLGGLFAGLGIGLTLSFGFVAGSAIATIFVVARWLRVLPQKAADETPGPQQEGTSPATLLVWFLGLLAFCAVFGDGAAENWSTVYLHDIVGATPSVAAFGLATYSASMIAGRLCGDYLSDRIGSVRLVAMCALVSAAGMVIVLTSEDIFWAVAGFGLTGLGFSCIYPKIVAAAGHLDPSRAARNITRVSGAGFVGLLVSPGLIGVLADRWGLATALWLPVLLTVGLAMAAPVLRAKRSGPRASQH
jgi:predicted MFS family arabinose efflux permease